MADQNKLLSLDGAAELLGYSVKGLRNIVDRSRAKSAGARSPGPTIRFFQTSKGAPVKFRQEWIEEFIDTYTIDPNRDAPPPLRQQRETPRSSCELLDI